MNNNLLPTDDLKKFGIIETDNSFLKKLSPDDIQKFLNGFTIVADNEKSRVTFQLTENNSQLKVNFYERDRNLSELLENSKKEIQYSDGFSKYNINDEKNSAQISWTKTAFIFDEKTKNIIEYDIIKNAKIFTEKIVERENAHEMRRYKEVLLQLKSFLQDKIEKYPEIAKNISVDLNIVSNEINSVDSISRPEMQILKESKNDIDLNVNDPDMFEDANRQREEDEQEKSRGLKR